MQQMIFIADLIRAPLCPSSGSREYYTGGCCLYNTLEILMMGIMVSETC